MISYCLGFVFDIKHPQVMLIQKNYPKYQVGKFNGIGGHKGKKEWAEDAMRRTCKTESGLDIQKWYQVAECPDKKNAIIIYIFCSYADLSLAQSKTDEIIFIIDLDKVKDLPLVPWTQTFFKAAMERIVREDI